ncbi:flagellar biosynthetic protein FliR [Sporosarcina sp. P26b]|uniref:flagellar biosynthetic protein FliR n=1 Tax=unclassified Sporosarcina TaxID=2647733 RepID=UPI000C16E5F9|nr:MULTISPECIES: flagellar biosynthetic protein FliR [unclassified Sporosarcina]PIC75220.1 flagellar biosynthetic protein FliR [Sporosarcina sp. P17b]PIC97184.1 flagellar biosynthetic protein FliR [Sporosarcina sp. P26b]
MNEIIPSLPAFLLILTRVTSFFVTLPLFSYKTIPATQRLLFGAILAWMMSYSITMPELVIDGQYILLVLKEAVVGLSIGIAAFIIMSAIQVAGGFIDFQMGFAIANVIDPQTGAQSPLLGQFLNSLAMLLLLVVNGHHMLLDGIFYSYDFVPITAMWPPFGSPNMAEFIVLTFAKSFAIAFQMAIPVVATLFLVDLALGITARAVPQLNIFVVGFPIKIGVSFLVIVTMASVFIVVMKKMFEIMIVTMRNLMILLGGG